MVDREDVRVTQWPRCVLLALAAIAYFAAPALNRPFVPAYNHFPHFAEAFLHGRLSLDAGTRTAELIPSADRSCYYLAYPPLPAILLMPFVALFGVGVTSAIACRTVSVLNVLIFDACLARLPGRIGLAPLSGPARLLFGAFFALGTVTWHNAEAGGDWHLAHAVTLAAELLALHEFLGEKRPLLIGGCVSLVLLTRPTAALACLFLILPFLRSPRVSDFARLAALPGAAILLLGAYNFARFGSPTDLGYSRMILSGTGKQLMETYGQFHPHFIIRNFYWFFLAPFWSRPGHAFPLGFDPNGLSLFLASPALLYCFLVPLRPRSDRLVRDATISIAAGLIPLLMYFNTGFVQFGHRFSMDYLPPLLLLVVIGMGPRPSRVAVGLMLVSILIQAWGNLDLPFTNLPAAMRP